MLMCTQCGFDNPVGSETCVRCGRGLDGSDLPEMPSAAITVVDGMRRLAASSHGPAVGASDTPPRVRLPNLASGEDLAGNPSSIRGLTSVEDPAPAAETPEELPPPPVLPRLVVVRGERLGVEYKLLDGKNYVGRTSERAVDIDLDGQEAFERTWTSRQHAVLTLDRGALVVEDLNSLNGTFVNRTRLHPGQQRVLQAGDVVQIGTVQLRVVW